MAKPFIQLLQTHPKKIGADTKTITFDRGECQMELQNSISDREGGGGRGSNVKCPLPDEV